MKITHSEFMWNGAAFYRVTWWTDAGSNSRTFYSRFEAVDFARFVVTEA